MAAWLATQLVQKKSIDSNDSFWLWTHLDFQKGTALFVLEKQPKVLPFIEQYKSLEHF